MKKVTESTDAHAILRRLKTMGDNDGHWWAFRNESIVSSVPDMYTHESGSYRVVPIYEWGARCSAEEVLIVLAHWIKVRSLKLTSGWQLQALVQKDHPLNITHEFNYDAFDGEVDVGPPLRQVEPLSRAKGVGPAVVKKGPQ